MAFNSPRLTFVKSDGRGGGGPLGCADGMADGDKVADEYDDGLVLTDPLSL